MGIQRVFLGWDRPCLRVAAQWLLDRYRQPDGYDLDAVLIVTPSHRAGRRLLEILVDAAASGGPGAAAPFIPPNLITPAELPERLYRPAGR
jgi:hypothetical protein